MLSAYRRSDMDHHRDDVELRQKSSRKQHYTRDTEPLTPVLILAAFFSPIKVIESYPSFWQLSFG